jgi:serine/threonine-protein kinase RsbW
MTKASDHRTVKLDVASRFEMLDVAQTVLAQVCKIVGFEEETSHYLAVAVRESVVNAIKHGNGQDESKRVEIQLTLQEGALEVQVKDQGTGIFFMRQFMDEVSYSFPSRGGTVVRMVKKFPA